MTKKHHLQPLGCGGTVKIQQTMCESEVVEQPQLHWVSNEQTMKAN